MMVFSTQNCGFGTPLFQSWNSICESLDHSNLLLVWFWVLTHCGLVTPYGDIELYQYWFRQWFVAWINGDPVCWHIYAALDLSELTTADQSITKPWSYIMRCTFPFGAGLTSTRIARFMGPTGWPHKPCYQGMSFLATRSKLHPESQVPYSLESILLCLSNWTGWIKIFFASYRYIKLSLTTSKVF